ncbi:alcohol dehydrogenase catalytic domain-containing protein [Streptococcus sp. SGI.013]|uniref:alcohol dehydrogenase catalytic domain-containing protein n=1 Tax=unclassified Streptococcus TaxID=2608887 RepID=UPI003D05AD72
MRNKSDLVSISVEKVGICGSDKQKIVQNNMGVQFLGHELLGIDNFRKKYVAVNPNIHCGKCFYCSSGEFNLCSNIKALGNNVDGGLKGSLQIPLDNVLYLKDNSIKYILLDPLAVIIHGLGLINITEGASTLVIGSGTLAKLLIWILNRKKIIPSVVTRHGCIKDSKKKLKVNKVYDDKQLITTKFQYTFEMVGYEQANSFEQAIFCTQKKGNIVCFGVFPKGYLASIELRSLFENEVKIQGVRSFIPADFKKAKEILDETNDEVLDVINIEYTKFKTYEQLLKKSNTEGVDKLVVDLT